MGTKSYSTRKPCAQVALVLILIINEMASSCALSSPSLPPVPFNEIQRVRQEFRGGQMVGLSYSPAAWDSMAAGTPPPGRHSFGPNRSTGKYELAFYVKLKSLRDVPFTVAPTYFVLTTVKGMNYPSGPATAVTSQPFPNTELYPQASTEGYIVFELAPQSLGEDQPSLLEYNDGAGNRAVRYLLISDMVQYEGLGSAVTEDTELRPPSQTEKDQERRWISGRWENQWVPGSWYGGVWYPGRYETFWIEGR